jgi:transcriptional regulator with XRE-family HTH domain
VIANLENGRRETLSVAELLILAAALDVPPVMLIAAVGHEAHVQILPGVEETTWRARGWILGALAPSYNNFSPRSWQQGRRAIELYDMHRLLVNECQQVLRRIRRLSGDRELDITDLPLLDDTAKLQHTTLVDVAAELSYGLDQLRTHRRHIQSEGFLLPEMPSVLAAMLRESDSGGRHYRQGDAFDVREDDPSRREEQARAVIYELMRAIYDEPSPGTGSPE